MIQTFDIKVVVYCAATSGTGMYTESTAQSMPQTNNTKRDLSMHSDVLNLPYILRTLKRVYKPTVGISTKLLKMSSFCRNMACGYRGRAGLT